MLVRMSASLPVNRLSKNYVRLYVGARGRSHGRTNVRTHTESETRPIVATHVRAQIVRCESTCQRMSEVHAMGHMICQNTCQAAFVRIFTSPLRVGATACPSPFPFFAVFKHIKKNICLYLYIYIYIRGPFSIRFLRWSGKDQVSKGPQMEKP